MSADFDSQMPRAPAVHDQARALIDRDPLSGISPKESAWLEDHIRQCSDCGRYADFSARTIRGLNAFSFAMELGIAGRTQEAISWHARQLQAERSRRQTFIRGFAVACAFTALGSALAWHGSAYIAQQLRLDAWKWQPEFVLFWILPSVVSSMLLLVGLAWENTRTTERSLI